MTTRKQYELLAKHGVRLIRKRDGEVCALTHSCRGLIVRDSSSVRKYLGSEAWNPGLLDECFEVELAPNQIWGHDPQATILRVSDREPYWVSFKCKTGTAQLTMASFRRHYPDFVGMTEQPSLTLPPLPELPALPSVALTWKGTPFPGSGSPFEEAGVEPASAGPPGPQQDILTWAERCRLPQALDRLLAALAHTDASREKLCRFRDTVRAIVDAAFSGRADTHLCLATEHDAQAVLDHGAYMVLFPENPMAVKLLYFALEVRQGSLADLLRRTLADTQRKPLPLPKRRPVEPLVTIDNSFWQDSEIDWAEGALPR